MACWGMSVSASSCEWVSIGLRVLTVFGTVSYTTTKVKSLPSNRCKSPWSRQQVRLSPFPVIRLVSYTLLKLQVCCCRRNAQSTSAASVAAPSVPSDERETTDRAQRVLIIDAMTVVQCIKKTHSRTSILHLKTAFHARIERMVVGYIEVRVILDRYVEGCLQENTRKKRATYVAAATARHVVHDGMSIITTSLKQLLSYTSTKHSLTCYLGQG